MAPKTPPPLTAEQLVDYMRRWRMDHGDPIARHDAMQWAAYVTSHGYHTQAVFVNFVIDGVPGMVVLFSTAQSTGLQRAGQDCLNPRMIYCINAILYVLLSVLVSKFTKIKQHLGFCIGM